jgi:isopenicillin N synthase-like dioxygenase
MTASQAVLKTVQELAAAVDEPPSRYVRPELDRHADEMPEPIPLIDLSRLNNDDEADKLRAALQTWGLFLVSLSSAFARTMVSETIDFLLKLLTLMSIQVTNHGIEDSLMDAMMSASREFFRQPAEEKKKCSNIVEGKPYEIEGYGNERAVSQDQILDWQDRLHLRVEPENERNFAKWPSHPESFRLPTTLHSVMFHVSIISFFR